MNPLVARYSEGEPAGEAWFYQASRAAFTRSEQKINQLTYPPSRDVGYIYFGSGKKDGWGKIRKEE
eukprot:329793-Karenia_brevis.AAC.1